MTVLFREMNTEEVKHYIEFKIPIYAENVSVNTGMPKEAALQDAEIMLHNLLTEENRNKDQYIGHIFCEESQVNVGIIWYNIQTERDRAFIYDIYIKENFRQKGYASAALTLLEDVMKERGIGTLALNVFANNAGAQHLYRKLGYETVTMTQAKKL